MSHLSPYSVLYVNGGSRRSRETRVGFFTTMEKKRYRPESDGKFKRPYQKNRRAIIAAGDVCAICGRPIDKALRFPDPMSASVDHIIPISKGGHPSAPDNLQLTHLICNQMKAARTTIEMNKGKNEELKRVGNRVLPLSMNWQNWNGA